VLNDELIAFNVFKAITVPSIPIFVYGLLKLKIYNFWATRPDSRRNVSYRHVIIENKSKKLLYLFYVYYFYASHS
jgi:hypothetical protein